MQSIVFSLEGHLIDTTVRRAETGAIHSGTDRWWFRMDNNIFNFYFRMKIKHNFTDVWQSLRGHADSTKEFIREIISWNKIKYYK